jgi:FMN reductase
MTSEGATHLLVVVGSVTAPGRLRRALEEAIARALQDSEQHGGLVVELIDLAERDLRFADGSDPSELDDDTASVIAAVFAADVVVFATPVYRGSMTGALKNVFDQLPVTALESKVVALAAMGASDHHFLGADRHLRDVLTFFGALVTPVSVYLNGGDFADGRTGDRAAEALDELIGGALELAAAIGDGGQLAPSPLAAGAIRR